jgi:hypothetical protein
MTTYRGLNMACPVCREDLFDANGHCPEEEGVAKILCPHLVHSKCLCDEADGAKYGVGPFGPRAGCPICGERISCWTSSNDISDFPGYWLRRIEKILQANGPRTVEGKKLAVPVQFVKIQLYKDATLNETSRAYLNESVPTCRDSDSDDDYSDSEDSNSDFFEDNGFYGALHSAGSVSYNSKHVFSGCLTTRGIWKYNHKAQTLWLWEWGDVAPGQPCKVCGNTSSSLAVCEKCKYSCEAVYYCANNPRCKELSRSAHARVCHLFKKYGPASNKHRHKKVTR